MQNDYLIKIQGLETHFFTDDGVVRAVDGVDLAIPSGKTLCVVGESGCGKSVTASSILRLVQKPGRIVEGSILYQDAAGKSIDLAMLDPKGSEIRAIRGKEISMIFQEPMSSLSAVHTVGNQICEAIKLHLGLSNEDAQEHAAKMLTRVGIPDAKSRLAAYPFELSGGMRQRVMIAMALSCSPRLLIADEPTTALDVTTQANILDLVRELQRDFGMSVVFITHDLGVVAEIADEVAVMYLGKVVETGTVEEIFASPTHPYTRALMRSIPRLEVGRRSKLASIEGMVPHPLSRPTGCSFHTRCPHAVPGVCDVIVPRPERTSPTHSARCLLYSRVSGAGGDARFEESAPLLMDRESVDIDGETPADEAATSLDRIGPESVLHPVLLEVSDLRTHFPIRKGLFRKVVGSVRAVDGVSFTIREGETLGLVGESGCGKTTVGRSILRMYKPDSGSVVYHGPDGSTDDLAMLDDKSLMKYRSHIRMIFQDPYTSLNPRLPVIEIIGEVLRTNQIASGAKLERQVKDLLNRVGLSAEYVRRYPHAFSGGERQRIGIARAVSPNPQLVVADEAVSALDVSVQAQTINLLRELQHEFGLTYMFIAHDLAVVQHISDRVAVMYVGKIVEMTETSELFYNPLHPYTEALLSAVPRPDPTLRNRKARIRLAGEVADAASPPSGCYFHPRCRYSTEMCKSTTPALREVKKGHWAACHYAETLELRGVEAMDDTKTSQEDEL